MLVTANRRPAPQPLPAVLLPTAPRVASRENPDRTPDSAVRLALFLAEKLRGAVEPCGASFGAEYSSLTLSFDDDFAGEGKLVARPNRCEQAPGTELDLTLSSSRLEVLGPHLEVVADLCRAERVRVDRIRLRGEEGHGVAFAWESPLETDDSPGRAPGERPDFGNLEGTAWSLSLQQILIDEDA